MCILEGRVTVLTERITMRAALRPMVFLKVHFRYKFHTLLPFSVHSQAGFNWCILESKATEIITRKLLCTSLSYLTHIYCTVTSAMLD